MKHLFTFLIGCLIALNTSSQNVPNTINYQGVARDASGNILANQDIRVRFSRNTWEEIHELTTNQFGLFNLKIGQLSNLPSYFDWENGVSSIYVELDPTGQGPFTPMGNAEFSSVPYAFHARTSEVKNTLEQAYDEGGPGEGRHIFTDAGPVELVGDGGFMVRGDLGGTPSIFNIPTNEPSMFYLPGEGALRSGLINPTGGLGDYSTAFGTRTEASGTSSFAVGYESMAVGVNAAAFGDGTSANGASSFSIGNRTEASGVASSAFGDESVASGNMSFAAGVSTIAETFGEIVIGTYSGPIFSGNPLQWVAEDRLFVIGNGSSSSNRSNALVMLKNGNTGIGVNLPTANLEIAGQVKINGGVPGPGKVLTSDADGLARWESVSFNTLDAAYDQGGAGVGRIINANDGAVRINGEDGLIVTGTFGSGDALELAGGGTKMYFNPRKAAFRAGFVNGSQWDDANVGNYSFATNNGNLAIGTSATAFGNNNAASGDYSFVAGGNVTAYSAYETVFGRWNTTYTPVSTTSSNASDRLFVVGNGTGSNARNDALVIMKNGNVGIDISTPTRLLDVNGTARIGTNGSTITNIIRATLTYDHPSIGANTTKFTEFAVPNAAEGSTVHMSTSQQLPAGLVVGNVRVSEPDVVEVMFVNIGVSPVNPVSMDYFFTVIE